MLVARADGLMHRRYDLDEALARIRLFAEAGADCVYVPMLPDLDAVRTVCAATPCPVNVLPVGPLASATRADLAEAGAARISLGSALARLTHAALLVGAGAVLEEGRYNVFATGASTRQIDRLLAEGGPPPS